MKLMARNTAIWFRTENENIEVVDIFLDNPFPISHKSVIMGQIGEKEQKKTTDSQVNGLNCNDSVGEPLDNLKIKLMKDHLRESLFRWSFPQTCYCSFL